LFFWRQIFVAARWALGSAYGMAAAH